MLDATIYCYSGHHKMLSEIKKIGYIPVGLGNDKFSEEWIRDNTLAGMIANLLIINFYN